ncbi:MAG: formylglycine-generating enzyme family protein [Nitrospinae bacterium]|nr:formylglycine-generating enzyme family protein [Nitrospinota bacterium]
MFKIIQQKQKFIITLSAIWALTLWEPSFAFERFGELKKQCQSTCHQAEHIKQSRQDKLSKPECRSCHVGMNNTSPFSSTQKSASPRGSGLLLKSLVQNMSAKNIKTEPTQNINSSNGMALIPAGEFVMGSNERWDDEAPEHISSTQAFYMDLNEVTNTDYKKFIDETKHQAPYHWPEGNIPKTKEQHPVVYVSWFDADNYCKWAGKRLPTEQEWEKAARGSDGLIYPWGNQWSLDKSNNPYKHSTGTVSIGSFPEGKSPYGLNDMSGNVWEWVDSYYLPHPGNPVTRAEYGKDKRVLKGGSWFDCLSYGCGLSAPTFNRSFFTPEVKNNSFGFRCAKDAG